MIEYTGSMERRSPIAFVLATLLPALLCILLSTPSWAAPTTVRSIQFSGNTAFSSRELAEGILTKEGGPYSPRTLDADIRSVVDRFRTAGFLDVRVAIDGPLFSTDSTDVEIRLAIHEGPLSHLERITFAGMTHFAPEDVVARFSSRIGSPLDVSLFEQDLDGLLERYERIGYPLAECRVENILRVPGPDADSLFVTVRVNEGERITIDEIRVQGNKTTDPAVVVRETRMQLGELFNTARVNAIRQRLQRLNIFSDVSEPELYTRNDKGGLLITVQEGNTNTFDGVLGYIPAVAGEGSGYVTGLASIAMRNLFGTGRKLNFNWQRVDRHSQELGVQYVEPWVLGAPVNVGFGLDRKSVV
jgi:outer membrane protein assembly factor BamA